MCDKFTAIKMFAVLLSPVIDNPDRCNLLSNAFQNVMIIGFRNSIAIQPLAQDECLMQVLPTSLTDIVDRFNDDTYWNDLWPDRLRFPEKSAFIRAFATVNTLCKPYVAAHVLFAGFESPW